jgi:pimeloyl-ACP methyl ester carboxylesterase
MAEVVVDGLRIAYAEAGEGPALVLLHGGMDDSRSWRLQLEGLSRRFRVLAWDAPGCGRSDDPPSTWRMAEFADCAAGWLHAIGVDRGHVLGLSWGSTIALELYRRHRALPASLVLASAYAGWAGSLPPEETHARLGGALAGADRPPEEVAEAWRATLAPGAGAVADELTAMWAENSGRRHPAGYEAAVRSMAEADLRPVLAEVRVPTVIVHGELDERAPLHVAKALQDAIPRAELVVIPGAGHLCNVEAPEVFNGHVGAFLTGPAGG